MKYIIKEILIEDYSKELKSETNKLEHVEKKLDFYSIIKILDYEEKIILVLYYMEKQFILQKMTKELITAVSLPQTT